MASPSYAEDGKKVVRRRLPQAGGSKATRTYWVVRSLSQVTLALGNRLHYVAVESGAGKTIWFLCPRIGMPWLDKLRDATLVNLIQFEKSCFEPRETGFIRHELGAREWGPGRQIEVGGILRPEVPLIHFRPMVHG
jgi:hypothetical protein